MPPSSSIAIVDDDEAVRGSLDSLLRSAGFSSSCFSSGEALLDTDDPSRFACIITDLHMPGMSGLELQSALVQQAPSSSVIMMTAYPTTASERLARQNGAIAFLVKPVDPDALLSLIEG